MGRFFILKITITFNENLYIVVLDVIRLHNTEFRNFSKKQYDN